MARLPGSAPRRPPTPHPIRFPATRDPSSASRRRRRVGPVAPARPFSDRRSRARGVRLLPVVIPVAVSGVAARRGPTRGPTRVPPLDRGPRRPVHASRRRVRVPVVCRSVPAVQVRYRPVLVLRRVLPVRDRAGHPDRQVVRVPVARWRPDRDPARPPHPVPDLANPDSLGQNPPTPDRHPEPHRHVGFPSPTQPTRPVVRSRSSPTARTISSRWPTPRHLGGANPARIALRRSHSRIPLSPNLFRPTLTTIPITTLMTTPTRRFP